MLSRAVVRSTLSAMRVLLWFGVPDRCQAVPDRCHGDRPLGTVASGSRPRAVVSGHQFQGHQSVDGGLGPAGVRPSPAGPCCVQDALLGGGQVLHYLFHGHHVVITERPPDYLRHVQAAGLADDGVAKHDVQHRGGTGLTQCGTAKTALHFFPPMSSRVARSMTESMASSSAAPARPWESPSTRVYSSERDRTSWYRPFISAYFLTLIRLPFARAFSFSVAISASSSRQAFSTSLWNASVSICRLSWVFTSGNCSNEQPWPIRRTSSCSASRVGWREWCTKYTPPVGLTMIALR